MCVYILVYWGASAFTITIIISSLIARPRPGPSDGAARAVRHGLQRLRHFEQCRRTNAIHRETVPRRRGCRGTEGWSVSDGSSVVVNCSTLSLYSTYTPT